MNDDLQTKVITNITDFLHAQAETEELKKIKVPEGYSLVNVQETTDKIDAVAEEIKEQGHQLISQVATRFGFGGLIVGAALGGALGYFITRRKLETKYSEIAASDIAEMREHYRNKELSLENTVAKPQLEELVREQGYSNQPPIGVTPPTAVVEAAEAAAEEEARAKPSKEVRDENVFKRTPPTEEELGAPLAHDDWDYENEKRGRSPLRPYVIHRDEKDENDIYDTVTYTYYEIDDVLCNERDEPVAKDERDALVGEANLEKFGHGSNDPSIVYIRNDRLEMQMEVVQSPNAFAEEVHGFRHSESSSRRHRRERSSPDDE